MNVSNKDTSWAASYCESDGKGIKKTEHSGMKVALVGLGSMGAAMAGNLIRAGHSLVVYKQDAEPRGRCFNRNSKVRQRSAS